MFIILLSILSEKAPHLNYTWLLTAALPFALLLARKNKISKRMGFFKRWFLKMLLRKKAKGKKVKVTDILLFLLIVGAVGALLVWLLGWTWAILLILLFFLILGTKKGQDSDF